MWMVLALAKDYLKLIISKWRLPIIAIANLQSCRL
jgi:hypothetical protein